MNRLASQALLLSLIALMGGLLIAFWTHPLREGVVTLATLSIIGLSLALERIWPFAPQWNHGETAETWGDIGSFGLVFVALDGALKWLTPFLALSLMPAGLIPEVGLSLTLQVGIITLWIEFAAWASHALHHRLPALWALHAMHHSTERLYTLNNFRFHPLNHVLNHLGMMLPPIALGFSPDALLIYAALAMPMLLLQHSNIAFDFGRLNLIFNTNDLHRWHHSAASDEGMQNLGRALVIWDQVFGTYLRRPGQSPAQLGLFAVSRAYPQARRFWAQLWWPFTPACCRKPA